MTSVFKVNDDGRDYVEQDPQDKLDYVLDWTDFVGALDISASTWASTPNGLTLSDAAFSAKQTTITIAGGVVGQVYTVTNHVTFAGREKDRSFDVVIKQA